MRTTHQLIGFATVGVLSAAIDAGVFWVLVQFGMFAVIASAISFLSAFVVNYRGNRDVVFRAQRTPAVLYRYIALVAFNLLLSTGGVALALAAGLTPIGAKVLTMVVIAVFNFVAMRLWVFRTRKPHLGVASQEEPNNPR
jgi:putative flippase GtrA